MNDHLQGSRWPVLGATGLGFSVLGVIGYFVVVFRLGAWLPSVRNDALPNWILIALGLGLSGLAFLRATRRGIPGLLLGLNVAVAAAFSVMLYVITVVPPASGPALGASAPTFALADQNAKTVRLEDFRGSPVLLVFYRGHW